MCNGIKEQEAAFLYVLAPSYDWAYSCSGSLKRTVANVDLSSSIR